MKPDIACVNHPEREGFFPCRYCGDSFCEACVKKEPGFYRCRRSKCVKAYKAEAAGPPKGCLHCGFKNLPLALFCRRCGQKTSSIPSRKDLESPVTVAKFATVVEASLARTTLASQGIESFIADEAVGTLYSGGNTFLGGVRLQIREGNKKKAQKILSLDFLKPKNSPVKVPHMRGICRYCRETFDRSKLKEEHGILYCRKPQCLKAFQREIKKFRRFCPSCGAEAPFSTFYCINCGKKLKKKPFLNEPEWVTAVESPNTEKTPASYAGPAGSCRYCGKILTLKQVGKGSDLLHCRKAKCLKAYRAEIKSLSRVCPSCGTKIPYPKTVCAECGARVSEIPLELEPGKPAVDPSLPGQIWGFRWAIWLWLTLLSIEVIPGVVFSEFHFWKGVLPNHSWMTGVFSLNELACVCLILYWTKQFFSFSWRESLKFLGFKAPNPRQLLAAVLILVPVMVGNFLAFQGYQREGVVVQLRWDWGTRLVGILVGAGLFEEALYRGFLFRFLRQGRSFISAALLTSGFWALSHFTHMLPFYGPWHAGWGDMPELMFQVFVDGVMGAYLFEKGGYNIWGFMLVHVGYDIYDLVNIQGADFYVTDLPENYFDIGHWFSVLVTVPVILWLLPSGTKAREAEKGRTPAVFQGNVLGRQWKPLLVLLVLFSGLALAFFLASAPQLSEDANDHGWQKLVDSHPRYADGYRRWAYDLWLLDQPNKTVEKCQEALAIDPKNYKAWLLWGKVLREKKHYGDAVTKFQKAAECAPHKAALYLWWGFALERDGKEAEAIEKYKTVLALQPDETAFVDYASWRIDRLVYGKKD
jgi:membrane protease YdiL (CAAX protease family)